MIRFTILIITLFAQNYLWAQDSVSSYSSYKNQIKESFKNESLLYRWTNRYEVTNGFSRYAIGPAIMNPIKGWNDISNSWGVRYRRNHFEFAASFWNGAQKETTDTASFTRLSLGYFSPVNSISLGKKHMGVAGFLIQPAGGFGYTRTATKSGLYVAPALHLDLPFLSIGLRANMEYTFGGGFNLFPEISLQLDALWEIFDPNNKKVGTYYSSGSYVENLGMGWYKVTHTEYANPFVIKDVGPFWGVTPRVGRAFSKWSYEPYSSYGIGVSGRLSFFGLDIRVDKAKLITGVVKNVDDLDPTVADKFENEKVKGLVNTREITFEGNFNIPGLLLSVFKKNAISKMGNTTTPLNRFNFNLGFTKINPGNANYVNEDIAKSYTDDFFTQHPNVERNAINDPLIHKKEWGVTYGISYEMGAVGVRINNRLSKSSGRGTTIDVYYILPISKLAKVYSKN